MNPDDHLDVASGAIVPSSCGELAFRVIKKVCMYVEKKTRRRLSIFCSDRLMKHAKRLLWP